MTVPFGEWIDVLNGREQGFLMKGRLLWPVWPGPTYAGHIYGKMKKWKQLSAGKG